MVFEKDFHEIPTYMFKSNSKIQTIQLPNDITILEEGAFDYCSSLSSIVLPKNLTTIGKWCFRQCYALQEINLPDTITEIKDSAFYNCDSLEGVVLPPQITTIEPYTFSGCEQLKNITIPSLVTSIGDYALDGCSYLEKIVCLAMTAPTIKKPMNFTGISVPSEIQKVLLINDGAVGYDEGKWKTYMESNGYVVQYISVTPNSNEIIYKSLSGNIIEPTSGRANGMPTIVSNTYEKGFGKMVFEKDITDVSYKYFDGNTDLCEIQLPNGVGVNQYGFLNCTNLYSIKLHSNTPPTNLELYDSDNIGINVTDKEKVIYIPQDADFDSYLNYTFRTFLNNANFVLKNFDGELLYSI